MEFPVGASCPPGIFPGGKLKDLKEQKYKALDHRCHHWRECRVVIKPRGGRHKGPRNCLVVFDGESEGVVRPWRGIRKAE